METKKKPGKKVKKKFRNEAKILSMAFSILGSRTSEKKAAAVRENGKLGGRPFKPLEEIPCTCNGDNEHKASCLKGKALKRRSAITLSESNNESTNSKN